MSFQIDNTTRLIAFGDSWTAGHGVELDIHCKEVISPNSFIDNLRISNGWPKHLANLFNIPFVNFGWCNFSNLDILQKIKENKNYFEKNDLIIVMLSFPYRGESIPKRDIGEIIGLLEGYNYFLINSFSKSFSNELDEDLSELKLDRFLAKDLTMKDILIEYEKEFNQSVWEYNFRFPYVWQSTDYGDTHPNHNGYKIIAKKIYELISEYDNNTCSRANKLI